MEENKLDGQDRTRSLDLDRYLEFDLGNEQYAFHLLLVREVIPVPETTPVPKAPSYFKGIMNLRGHVISVVDLRQKLGVTPKEDREEAVIIVDIEGAHIGAIVDSINRVLSFSKDQISEVPDIESQVNGKFIQGVFQKESSLTVLLDIEKVLDADQIRKMKKQAA